MTDESAISFSKESKSIIRNYAMMIGFLAIAIQMAAVELLVIDPPSDDIKSVTWACIYAAPAAILMISGTVLALVHKRDQTAITFLIFSATMLLGAVSASRNYYEYEIAVSAIVMVLMGLMMIFTRNEQRYVCSAMLLSNGLLTIFCAVMMATGGSLIVPAVLWAIVCIAIAYCALCIGLENPKLPGYGLLTADEGDETKDGNPVHFKVSGAVIGYMTFAIPILSFIMHDAGMLNIGDAELYNICTVCGIMLVFIGVLMLFAGRMRFTPFLFMALGCITIMGAYLCGMSAFVVSATLIILALVTLFRSERRILVGIAILVYAVSWLCWSIWSSIEASMFMNAITFVILTYVCFALCSDGRLKLL